MLEPARFSSPLEMYRLVCSCLVLASSRGSEVQSQAPCVTPMCSAVRFPWKPLEFCVASLGEDMAAPSAILCRVFSSPFTFAPSLSSPALLQRKFFQSPRQRLSQTHPGRKSCSFRILVGKRNGLMLKYPPCHVDTFLPPTRRVLSEQQGTPGSSAPAARSSAIRGARSGASPLTLAVFNHTSVGSNRFSQCGKGRTR